MAEITLYSRQSIKSWMESFIEFDYEGLIDRKGGGKKPRLHPEKKDLMKFNQKEMEEELQQRRYNLFWQMNLIVVTRYQEFILYWIVGI